MKADAEAFELGQTAMFIRESWVIGDIKQKAPNLKYATAPLPKGSIALVTNLYVTSEGEKGKAAWEFAMATNEPAEPRVAARQRRLAAEPQGRRLFRASPRRRRRFGAFLSYPKDYTFFTLPAIAPIEEILTRLAARLTRGYTDPALAEGRRRDRRVPRRSGDRDEHHPEARPTFSAPRYDAPSQAKRCSKRAPIAIRDGKTACSGEDWPLRSSRSAAARDLRLGAHHPDRRDAAAQPL